jgi:hypothetical protein
MQTSSAPSAVLEQRLCREAGGESGADLEHPPRLEVADHAVERERVAAVEHAVVEVELVRTAGRGARERFVFRAELREYVAHERELPLFVPFDAGGRSRRRRLPQPLVQRARVGHRRVVMHGQDVQPLGLPCFERARAAGGHLQADDPGHQPGHVGRPRRIERVNEQCTRRRHPRRSAAPRSPAVRRCGTTRRPRPTSRARRGDRAVRCNGRATRTRRREPVRIARPRARLISR